MLFIKLRTDLTDTLVSGQVYLRPLKQNPVFLRSHTNSVFLHSRKRPALVMSAYENFHCTSNLGANLVGPWRMFDYKP